MCKATQNPNLSSRACDPSTWWNDNSEAQISVHNKPRNRHSVCIFLIAIVHVSSCLDVDWLVVPQRTWRTQTPRLSKHHFFYPYSNDFRNFFQKKKKTPTLLKGRITSHHEKKKNAHSWTQGTITWTSHQGAEKRASQTTSSVNGVGPSAPMPPRRSRRDMANARAEEQARMEPHRRSHACLARDRMIFGSLRTLALANRQRNWRHSSDQRPPTSLARTTNRARPCWPATSFATHTSKCTLQGKASPNTPTFGHAARWWPRASRGGPHRQEREVGGRGSHTAKEQDSEKLGFELAVERSGAASERQSRQGSSLWSQQSARRLLESRPDGRRHEEIVRLLGCLVLPTMLGNARCRIIQRIHVGAFPICQSLPTWGDESHLSEAISGGDHTCQMEDRVFDWQLPHDQLCHRAVPSPDHAQPISPTRSKSCSPASHSTPDAQATHVQRQTANIPRVVSDAHVQKNLHTSPHGHVVAGSERASGLRMHHPEM